MADCLMFYASPTPLLGAFGVAGGWVMMEMAT